MTDLKSNENEKDVKKAAPVEAKDDTKPVDAKKTDQKDDEKKDNTKKEEKKELLDDMMDDGDLILEGQRESIPLTPANCRFLRSKGNLISLDLHAEGKEPEFFERVVLLRAFPVTNPDEFISVREPDTKLKGRGKEIGMIRRMSDFDEQTNMLILEELDRRYFSPVLLKITSIKDKFGYSYWDAETSAGNVTFVVNNPFGNIRILEDGRMFINDVDGNSFVIPDPKKLDPASYRKIDIYL